MFCVYFTSYRGNKLPPFYIGSSSIDKVQNGYHGSVSSKKYSKIWHAELKANPGLFKTKILSCHCTRIKATNKEALLQKKLNVVKSTMYINMSIAQINGCHGMDVSNENNPMFGRKMSHDQIQKFSGENHGLYGTNNYKIWVKKYGKEEADQRALAVSQTWVRKWKDPIFREKMKISRSSLEHKARKSAASREINSRPEVQVKKVEGFQLAMRAKRLAKFPDWTEEQHKLHEEKLLNKTLRRKQRLGLLP